LATARGTDPVSLPVYAIAIRSNCTPRRNATYLKPPLPEESGRHSYAIDRLANACTVWGDLFNRTVCGLVRSEVQLPRRNLPAVRVGCESPRRPSFWSLFPLALQDEGGPIIWLPPQFLFPDRQLGLT